MAKQKMVIIVGVDSDEQDAGYGVVRADTFKRWTHSNAVMPKPVDRFGWMFGQDDRCDTFNTFDDAMKFIAEAEGKLVNVHAAVAY